MRRLNALLNDRFEEIARAAAKGFAPRLATAVMTASLMALAVRPAVAAARFAGFLCAEAWVWVTLRPMAGQRPGTPLQRLHFGLAA